MAFSWSSFRLPRPWTRSDEQRDQDDGISEMMPSMPQDNGRLVLDDNLNESLDNDDLQSQSPADRRARLKRVSEQLMWAWAQECPGLADDFQTIDAHIDVLERRSRGIQFEDDLISEGPMRRVSVVSRHDAHVHQDEYMALGATAAPIREQAFGESGVSQYHGWAASQARDPSASRHGDPSASRRGDPSASRHGDPMASRHSDPMASRRGDPAASWHGDPMASRHHDPAVSQDGDSVAPQYGDPAASLYSGSAVSHYGEASGYPVLEPDVGTLNIMTPSLGYGMSLNYKPQPCSSSETSVTTTYTLGRPVMSTHVRKQAGTQELDGGMSMAEESSLHGRIWLPVTHSTPVGAQSVRQTVAGGGLRNGRVAQDDKSNTSAWVLVSDDRPGLNRNYKDHHLNVVNPQVVPGRVEHQTPEDMVSQHGTPGQRMAISYDAMMARMEPVLRQMFQAGVQWDESAQTLHTAPAGPPPYQAASSAAGLWQMQGLHGGQGAPHTVPVQMLAGVESSPVPQQTCDPVHVIQPVPRTGVDVYGLPLATAGTQALSACPSTPPTSGGNVVMPSVVSNRASGRVKEKKVANYNGKTSWADYLVQFNIAARLNGWDDSQKAMELATSLEGNARGVLADMTPEQQLNFTVLVNKLTQRFEPEGQLGIYQTQLSSRRRKRNETIPELLQEISRLVRKAYPAADEQMRGYMAVSSFISALGNEAQELFVYQKEPQSLDEAGKAALSFETFQAARNKDVPSVRFQVPDNSAKEAPSWARDWFAKVEKQLSGWARQTGKGRGANGGKPPNSGTRRLGTCHHCGAEGHWIRECPKRKTSAGQQTASDENGSTDVTGLASTEKQQDVTGNGL